MSVGSGSFKSTRMHRVRAARRDFIAGGITVAAILLFASTGSDALDSIIHAATGRGGENSGILTSTVLLNIALLLFGWRRYRDIQREVVERTEAEERAQTLASRDPLTGLYNRRSLIDLGGKLVATAEGHGRGVGLLLIDLDRFKNINDMHGHVVGDALLRACAALIIDAAPAGALCARLGGDEFACAFEFDPADPLFAGSVADRIVSRLGQAQDLGGVHVHIGASCGLAASGADCPTIEAAMRRADIAMYGAKKAGRNGYAWFDKSMERELHTRNEIEAGLRHGIPRGEIVPYYEQQVDLSTGALHGFEMLARWEHPTQGIIVPDVFIPIAEETGLIADLSLSVMRQAFEEARGWDPSLMLSVNISPAQLKDPWLAQKVVKLLVETGFPANRLEIEITETSLFENLALAQTIVASLKNQGIKLALDDFGTGYSSLAHLRALPFDRIKIDRSFVTSINDGGDSAAIVDAITKLAESLGLPLTAEGIEDAQIEARLRQIGGNYNGQGWLFGKPMSVAQVRTLLADKSLLPTARAAEPEAPSAAPQALRKAS